MKKILLLLMIAGTAFTVSAQTSNHRNDNKLYHYKNDRDTRYDLNGKRGRKAEMKRQMAVINRDYDARMNYVKGNPHLRRNERSRQINELQMQRKIALDQCRDRFGSRKHRDFADGKRW